MNITKCAFYLVMVILLTTSCNIDNNDFDFNNEELTEALSPLPDAVNYPVNNLYSEQKENLGRILFWDPILSGGLDVSCASCHHPEFAYADGRDLSLGTNGTGLGPNRRNGSLIKRNSPTILNSAFNGIDNNGNYTTETAPMFWDNRASSLEEQALQPMLDKLEMRGEDIEESLIMDTIIHRLESIPAYKSLFSEAFGSEEINEAKILQAIATFERSIIANNSRFDQYMKGDQDALSNFELEGLEKFLEAGCADCHEGAMLSDYELHTLGVPNHAAVTDRGANGNFDFRTPTLRNIELTAPYMHNGRFETLEDVVDFYKDISDRRRNAINDELNFNQIDEEARELDLGRRDIDEIVAFLRTLTDENFDKTIPAEVPSGLPVGGNIDH